jgi:2-iminobutanoate/2-iminopropanoate deaminase
MNKEIISTAKTPLGPYSQAVRAGELVFLSGQIPIRPEDGEVERGDIGRQTELVLETIRAILEAAGSGLEQVLKVTVYLTDLTQFSRMNESYARFFPEHPPARSTVEVSRLPKGAGIEMEVVALASGQNR